MIDNILSLVKAELEKTNAAVDIIEQGGIKELVASIAFTDDAVPLLVSVSITEAAKDTLIAQIYVPITDKLSEGAAAELKKLIPSLNFFRPIGTYGIFKDNELFCKYAIALSESEDAELRAAETFDALIVFYNFLDETFPLLIQFINGNMTFDQAVKEKLIEPI